MTGLLLVALVAAASLALFLRSTVFSSDYVRRAKWRIRFLMHPGPGWATCGELAARWSRLAALHHGRRARPSLKLRHRLILPATAYAVRLGRGQWGRRLYSRNEDERLIVAAKRTGKSGIVADRVIDPLRPGAVEYQPDRHLRHDVRAEGEVRGRSTASTRWASATYPTTCGGTSWTPARTFSGPGRSHPGSRSRTSPGTTLPGSSTAAMCTSARCSTPPRSPGSPSWTSTGGTSCKATASA